MSSINTNKYRTFLAQQFRTTLLLGGADSTVKADITSTNTALMSAGAATTSEFYLGVGRPQSWDNDAAPPAPSSLRNKKKSAFQKLWGWLRLVWKMFPRFWRVFLSYLEPPSTHIQQKN